MDNAVRDGRIPVADRNHWVGLLTTSPTAAQTLAGLPKGFIPVDGPRGYTGGADEAGELSLDDYILGQTGPRDMYASTDQGEPAPHAEDRARKLHAAPQVRGSAAFRATTVRRTAS